MDLKHGTFVILEHPLRGWTAGIGPDATVGHYTPPNPLSGLLHRWEDYLLRTGAEVGEGRGKSLLAIPDHHLNIHRLDLSKNERPLAPFFLFSSTDEGFLLDVWMHWVWRRDVFEPDGGDARDLSASPFRHGGHDVVEVVYTLTEKAPGWLDRNAKTLKQLKEEGAPPPKEEKRPLRKNLLDAIKPKKNA